MTPRFRLLSRMWSSEWGLTAFLVLLVVMVFIILPLGRLLGTGGFLFSIFFSLLLISGVATVSGRRVPALLVTGLVIVTFVLRWMTHVVSGPMIASASALSAFACFGLLAGVVTIQVFREGPITSHRIQGAVAVYLLLGVIWAFAYDLVLLQFPGSFQPAELGEDQSTVISNLIYFSFVTITTVGYGGILPVNPMVRSLATLEALVGQLYPVILIGRLVAVELQHRQSR
jgi:Ion channel